MLRTLVSSIVSGLFAAILLTSPALAQVNVDGDNRDFGPLTSAEQATLFDAGVEAYDEGNFAAAYHIWLPLAQNDNMSAQRNVAHLLRRGMGIEADPERAVYFYRRASENGLVSAMVNLSSMLRAGQGVGEPEYREAAQWLYIASQAGDPRAQYLLGIMAARGEGMEANRDLAIRLFTMASEQGLREARQRLAEAGIEPESIGDAPERSGTDAPSSLEPLPDFAPHSQRQQTLEPQLRTTQAEPVVTRPQVAAAAPAPVVAQPRAEPVVTRTPERVAVTMPSGSTSSAQTRTETRPTPTVVQATAPAHTEPRPAAQPQATQPRASQPQSQNIPSVQSVSIQPTPPASERRAQRVIRSTADLVVLPPAPSPNRDEPEPEAEDEEEMNPGLSRLLGGTN